MSLTPRRELRGLALPSEIMRLANLEGYLKFPGPFPVASIKLKYVARAAAAERFVARAVDGVSEVYEPDEDIVSAGFSEHPVELAGQGDLFGDPRAAGVEDADAGEAAVMDVGSLEAFSHEAREKGEEISETGKARLWDSEPASSGKGESGANPRGTAASSRPARDWG